MAPVATLIPKVELPADHPGVGDLDYRARRDAIATISASYRAGEPLPLVEYTPTEHEVWRTVSTALRPEHERHAVREYLDAAARLDLPAEHVPQLADVDARLRELSGFGLVPVPGLVPTTMFYGLLAERRFAATQYVRHHSVPLYTPEPDIVHEVIGHANMLASPTFAALYEEAGKASLRAETPDALEFFSRVFWFTVEFGVCYEDGDLRAYGAGILSSAGELEAYGQAELRPFDVAAMGTQAYDITTYQPLLYVAASFQHAVDAMHAFFSTYDVDAHRRYVATSGARGGGGGGPERSR
jgi:phenylalanine-4-hydroxylase